MTAKRDFEKSSSFDMTVKIMRHIHFPIPVETYPSEYVLHFLRKEKILLRRRSNNLSQMQTRFLEETHRLKRKR